MFRIALVILLLAQTAFSLEVTVADIDADERAALMLACAEYDRAARVDGASTIEECIVALVDTTVRNLLRAKVRRERTTTLREAERAQLAEWTENFTPQADLARCGDGEPDAGEECDPGLGNFDDATPDTGCRSACRNPYCGDGVKDGGETCDPGANARCKNDCSGLMAIRVTP
jgi:hypothetical protein